MRKLILFAFAFLFVSQAYGAVTVGQFIDRIATTRDLSSLKLDRNIVLTEGDMVKISVAFGINVTTQTPNKVVTEKQVDTYFGVFNYELRGGSGGNPPNATPPGQPPGPPPGNPPHGKGKGKGKHHSPSDPDDNDDDDDDD